LKAPIRLNTSSSLAAAVVAALLPAVAVALVVCAPRPVSMSFLGLVTRSRLAEAALVALVLSRARMAVTPYLLPSLQPVAVEEDAAKVHRQSAV
jgi:hypothetical protein